MLFVIFHLGDDRYAIEAAQVVEILPLIEWKCIPRAPAGVTGMIDYRGMPVPLIDLTELALGRRSLQWMSTRIIVVKYFEDARQLCLLGLIAEKTTGTIRRNEGDFSMPGLEVADAPYLGPIASTPSGVIQRIEIKRLLPESLRSQLFVDRSSDQDLLAVAGAVSRNERNGL